GVGIAPIMSMLRTMADRGDRRPILLIYGNRTWENVLFRHELAHLVPRLALELVHVLQTPPADWTGASGILDQRIIHDALPYAMFEATFFLCGPKPMTDSVQRTLRRLGVPLRRIRCELFDMA